MGTHQSPGVAHIPLASRLIPQDADPRGASEDHSRGAPTSSPDHYHLHQHVPLLAPCPLPLWSRFKPTISEGHFWICSSSGTPQGLESY